MKRVAYCVGYQRPAVARDKISDCRVIQKPVNGWERATRGCGGLQHNGSPPRAKRRKVVVIRFGRVFTARIPVRKRGG